MNAKEIRSILEKTVYVDGSYSSLEEYKNNLESLLHEALKALETEETKDSIQVKRNSNNEIYTDVMLSQTEIENSLLCVKYVEKKLDVYGIETVDLFVLSLILQAYLKQPEAIEAAGIAQ